MPKKSIKKVAKRTVKKAVKKTIAKAAPKAAKKATKKTATNPTGAGRPKGSGQYGCPTKSVRVPIHLVEAVKVFAQKKVKSEQ
jgi:hypothetical protein